MVGARRLDHLWPIAIKMDHRLLAIHILAGLHRVHRGLLVPVIRRADNYRVNVFAGQNLVVVARRKNVAAPEFLAVRQPAIVAIGRCHQFHARHLHSSFRVVLALATGADQRNLDMIVGCYRFGRLLLHCRQRMHPCSNQ